MGVPYLLLAGVGLAILALSVPRPGPVGEPHYALRLEGRPVASAQGAAAETGSIAAVPPPLPAARPAPVRSPVAGPPVEATALETAAVPPPAAVTAPPAVVREAIAGPSPEATAAAPDVPLDKMIARGEAAPRSEPALPAAAQTEPAGTAAPVAAVPVTEPTVAEPAATEGGAVISRKPRKEAGPVTKSAKKTASKSVTAVSRPQERK